MCRHMAADSRDREPGCFPRNGVASVRQRGAETVEFAITLLLFFMVFFLIVDFSIAMFDQGSLINASRDGARQASLYWVDPADFDPLTPLENQRMKRSMVDSVINWHADNLIINSGMDALELDFRINDAQVSTAWQIVHSGDQIELNLGYSHQFIGLGSFAQVAGIELSAQTVVRVE